MKQRGFIQVEDHVFYHKQLKITVCCFTNRTPCSPKRVLRPWGAWRINAEGKQEYMVMSNGRASKHTYAVNAADAALRYWAEENVPCLQG